MNVLRYLAKMAPIGSRRPQLTAFRTPWVYIKKKWRHENVLIKPAVLDGMLKANSEGNSCSVLNDSNDVFYGNGNTTFLLKTSVVTTHKAPTYALQLQLELYYCEINMSTVVSIV